MINSLIENFLSDNTYNIPIIFSASVCEINMIELYNM
jgi:hypothetical protein